MREYQELEVGDEPVSYDEGIQTVRDISSAKEDNLENALEELAEKNKEVKQKMGSFARLLADLSKDHNVLVSTNTQTNKNLNHYVKIDFIIESEEIFCPPEELIKLSSAGVELNHVEEEEFYEVSGWATFDVPEVEIFDGQDNGVEF